MPNKMLSTSQTQKVRIFKLKFPMLQDALLDNNYFHINIRPFDGLNVAQPFETHPGIWDNAQMLCSRPILTIPAGPGWLNPTTAINGRRTYACIRGTNNSGLSGRGIAVNGSYSQNFSPPIASNNQASLFDNADYGIDIQGIDLDIRDARFQNIYCNSGFSNPCPIPYPGFSEWPTAIRSNANRANNVVFKNTFFACTNGVNAIRASRNIIESNSFPNTPGSNVQANIIWNIMVFDGPDASTGAIEKNTIHFGRAGIQVQGNRTSTILIRGNKIHNTRLGVVSWRNPRSDIRVVSNFIDASPLTLPFSNLPWNGIHYDELGFNSAVIRGNNIWSRTNGIYLTGIQGINGTNNIQVLSNRINMSTNALAGFPNPTFHVNHGIQAINLERPIISKNGIVGPSVYNPTIPTNRLRGIEVFINTHPRIYCNGISQSEYNLQINGDNAPGEVRRNRFNPGSVGIRGFNSALMLAQMSNGNPLWHTSDNEFICPFTTAALEANQSSNFDLAVWVYNPIPTQYFQPANPNLPACNGTLDMVSDVPGIPCQGGRPCTDFPPGTTPYISDFSPEFCNFSTTLARTSEEDEEDNGDPEVFPELPVSEKWVSQIHYLIDTVIDSLDHPLYLRLNLYRYLSIEDSLLLADSILYNWWHHSDQSDLLELTEIEQSLSNGEYEEAQISLDIWEPENDITNAIKSVYAIHARLGLDSVNYLTTSEKLILREIAIQCPDTMGVPVHLARSLLNVLDTFSEISVCEMNRLSEVDADSLQQDSSGGGSGEVLKVYPNPADQFVNLEHTLLADEGYVFRVINSLGHEMLNIQLEENEDIYEWDTSSIQQGMYYVFLYKDGLILEFKLLSVLH